MTEIHDALLAVISAWEADVQESEHLREIEAAYFDRTHGEMVRKLLDAQAHIEETEAALRRMSQRWADGQARIEALERALRRALDLDSHSATEEGHKQDMVMAIGILSAALAAEEKEP